MNVSGLLAWMMVVSVMTPLCSETYFDQCYQQAKKDCDNISSVRRELDQINSDLLELLTRRTAYVQRAGDLKSLTTKVANDCHRVQEQREQIVQISLELGLPVEVATATFETIVEQSTRYQQAYIDSLYQSQEINSHLGSTKAFSSFFYSRN
jgi:chorismate mutase